MKLSKDKNTLPGRKQVYRFIDTNGSYAKDVIALADEEADGEPLLRKVMENGKVTCKLPSIKEIRDVAAGNVAKLPQKYKQLTDAPTYPVEVSQALAELVKELKEKITRTEILNSNNKRRRSTEK